MSLTSLFGDETLTPQCSRARCSSDAVYALNWRNPKIHDPSRTKVWLTCDEHLDYLRDFLQARNFPVTVTTFDDLGGDNGAS